MMEIFCEYTQRLTIFCNKGSIPDDQLGYIDACENIEIFKVKLRWRKPSRLLKHVALFVGI